MHGRFFIYLAVIIGSLAIALDFASVDLALPDLERQFGLDLDNVQWVVNGYVLAFSVLMVAGGKLADAYGRRKIFLVGMAIFALASLLGGMAWSGPSIIAFRILQGVGAALLWPAMIGMACAAVGEQNRGVALGLIFGSCSLGNAAGPVVGGALTQWWSWRWVLWVNVPLALLTILIALWKVPKENIQGTAPRNDWLGMGTLTGGLVALMVMIYQGPVWGWGSWQGVSLGITAAILLLSFPFIEMKVPEPAVPLELMRNKEFLTLCLASMTICQMFFVVLLYFTQYAMKFLGDEPLWAGLRVVQFMLTYGLIAYFAGPLYSKFGARKLLLFGLGCSIIACALLGVFGPGAGPLTFNGSLVLLGVGVGCTIPNISSRAIETFGVEKAGLVSGVTFMCQLSGAAVLMAIGTACFSVYGDAQLARIFAQDQEEDARMYAADQIFWGAQTIHSLPDGMTVADTGSLAEELERAYAGGVQLVLWFSAALSILTLFLVYLFVPATKSGGKTDATPI